MIRVVAQLPGDITIGECVNKLRNTKYWVNLYSDLVFVSVDFPYGYNKEKAKKLMEDDLLILGLICDYITAMEIN